MYFIYLKKCNIIIPRYIYACSAPLNGYYLDLWNFINVVIFIIIIIINKMSYIKLGLNVGDENKFSKVCEELRTGNKLKMTIKANLPPKFRDNGACT